MYGYFLKGCFNCDSFVLNWFCEYVSACWNFNLFHFEPQTNVLHSCTYFLQRSCFCLLLSSHSLSYSLSLSFTLFCHFFNIRCDVRCTCLGIHLNFSGWVYQQSVEDKTRHCSRSYGRYAAIRRWMYIFQLRVNWTECSVHFKCNLKRLTVKWYAWKTRTLFPSKWWWIILIFLLNSSEKQNHTILKLSVCVMCLFCCCFTKSKSKLKLLAWFCAGRYG